jgi:CheY-like chemotaxis protein
MKKIIIVDDETGFTKLLKLNLERTGAFIVRVVNDATLAIEAMRQFAPDLALLDIVMPDMDGGDIVAQMKLDPVLAKIPVLMITALVGPKELSPGAVAQSGDLLMLGKPIRMETLLAAIQEQLG